MLYEFHRKQNLKKAGSVHATFLISGLLPASQNMNAPASNEQDHEKNSQTVQSSPYMSSSMAPQEEVEDELLLKSVVLVREEELEGEIPLFEPHES